MKYPNLNEERKLWKKGFKRVACLDEAGRGTLAGPVTAAAVVIVNTKYKILNTRIRDSKKLSKKEREEFYGILTKDPNIKWGIGRVSEKVIDKINILEATKLAMKKAITNLEKKPDFLILDGNFTLPTRAAAKGKKEDLSSLPAVALAKAGIDSKIPQKSIIKADEKVFSCSAASIIAKVTRDRIMRKYHQKYPHYRFDLHKGYPTKYHIKMLRKYGACKIHRRTFEPVRKLKAKSIKRKTTAKDLKLLQKSD